VAKDDITVRAILFQEILCWAPEAAIPKGGVAGGGQAGGGLGSGGGRAAPCAAVRVRRKEHRRKTPAHDAVLRLCRFGMVLERFMRPARSGVTEPSGAERSLRSESEAEERNEHRQAPCQAFLNCGAFLRAPVLHFSRAARIFPCQECGHQTA